MNDSPFLKELKKHLPQMVSFAIYMFSFGFSFYLWLFYLVNIVPKTIIDKSPWINVIAVIGVAIILKNFLIIMGNKMKP